MCPNLDQMDLDKNWTFGPGPNVVLYQTWSCIKRGPILDQIQIRLGPMLEVWTSFRPVWDQL